MYGTPNRGCGVNRMTLRRAVSEALLARGFRRHGRMHHLRLQPGVSFWVDTGPVGKRTDIAPFVGIRFDDIERVVGELMELPFDAWVGTAGANVGYVLGQGFKQWEPPTAPEVVIEAIDAALQRLQSFASIQDLPSLWDLVSRDDPWWRYREMAALLIQGDRELIARRLEEAEDEFCRTEGGMCDQFHAFARQMRARIGD
jgi:hypothetical protein